MEKIAVFVDIDGVLNSHESSDKSIWDKKFPIDENLVGELKKIINYLSREKKNESGLQFEVDLILSSNWRIGKNLEIINEIFEPYGLIFKGKTEVLGIPRGLEIRKFMETHDEYNYLLILDDDIDMLSVEHFFIPINSETGLNYEDIYSQVEQIAIRNYNTWRDLNYLIVLSGDVYLSNQPYEWIEEDILKENSKDTQQFSSETLAHILSLKSKTGLKLVKVVNKS